MSSSNFTMPHQPIHDELHRIVPTAFIYNDEGKILILKRSPDKKVHPNKWGIPGGGLEVNDYINTKPDSGEGWTSVIEKALLREIQEEVGVTIGEPQIFGNSAFIRPDGIPVLVLRYSAKYISGNVKLDEDSTEYAWVGEDELEKYDIIAGVKDNLKTVFKSL